MNAISDEKARAATVAANEATDKKEYAEAARLWNIAHVEWAKVGTADADAKSERCWEEKGWCEDGAYHEERQNRD